MSFSSELKENLSKIPNLKNKELVKFELIGYLISNNTTCDKKNIYYTTVNEYNINRFSKLLSNMEISNFKIDIKGKNYVITLPKTNSINEIKYSVNDIEISSAFEEQIQNLNKIKEQEEMAIKALTRGIFLGSGSVNNPEKKYHLECQSTIDNSMVLRFFEYDSQIALDDATIEKIVGDDGGKKSDGVLTVTFPIQRYYIFGQIKILVML